MWKRIAPSIPLNAKILQYVFHEEAHCPPAFHLMEKYGNMYSTWKRIAPSIALQGKLHYYVFDVEAHCPQHGSPGKCALICIRRGGALPPALLSRPVFRPG